MEEILLNLGFSWTWSKALPYLNCLIVGIILFYFIQKLLVKRWGKYVSSSIIIIPFLIYFIVHPIYEGDFSNDYTVFKNRSVSGDPTAEVLTLIAIPNCPYCKEAIALLNKIQQRTLTNKIDFVILSSDSASLNAYNHEKFEGLNFKLSIDSTEYLRKISAGRFPTFCLKQKDQVIVWNNENFGAPAKDFVESKLKKLKHSTN
jgi:glutaredoxin